MKLPFIGLIVCQLSVTSFVSARDYTASFFGILPGGLVLNTRSIQFGIDYISQNGGGRLVFPVGRYLTGCIHLKSDVTLQLEEGSVLLGSVNPLDYDRQNTAFDHNYNTSLALILGLNQHDIGITGKGVIDGQGKELASAVGEMLNKGFILGGTMSRPNEDQRAMILNFFGCDQVTIKNITFKNSACWVECYNLCKNLTVDSISVESRAFWNNDGIDIVDCENVKISNSYFVCSDDGICLKTLDAGTVNQNIWIQNNSMTTEASGIKFGTASSGGFKNIHIINNTVFDTYRSAIALEAVDGAAIENIEIDSLKGENIGNGIFLRAGARKGSRKGRVENVSIENVTVIIRTETNPNKVLPALIITGLPDQIISNIRLKNIEIKLPGGADRSLAKISHGNLASVPEKANGYPEFTMFGELPAWGIYVRHVRDIQFSGISISAAKADFRTAVVLDDVHNWIFKKLLVEEPQGKKKIFTHNSSGITPK
jgi:polygalacturonase